MTDAPGGRCAPETSSATIARGGLTTAARFGKTRWGGGMAVQACDHPPGNDGEARPHHRRRPGALPPGHRRRTAHRGRPHPTGTDPENAAQPGSGAERTLGRRPGAGRFRVDPGHRARRRTELRPRRGAAARAPAAAARPAQGGSGSRSARADRGRGGRGPRLLPPGLPPPRAALRAHRPRQGVRIPERPADHEGARRPLAARPLRGCSRSAPRRPPTGAPARSTCCSGAERVGRGADLAGTRKLRSPRVSGYGSDTAVGRDRGRCSRRHARPPSAPGLLLSEPCAFEREMRGCRGSGQVVRQGSRSRTVGDAAFPPCRSSGIPMSSHGKPVRPIVVPFQKWTVTWTEPASLAVRNPNSSRPSPYR